MDYIYGKLSNVTNINEFIERIEECEVKVDECEQQVDTMTTEFNQAMGEFEQLKTDVNGYTEDIATANANASYAVEKADEAYTLASSYEQLIQEIQNQMPNKEDKANKVTSWSVETTNTNYPSEKLVKDTIDNLNSTLTQSIGDETTARENADALLTPKTRKVGGVSLGSDTDNLQGYTYDTNQTLKQKIDAMDDTIGGKQTQLTQSQLDAVNSGVTSSKVTSYDSHITNKENPHEVTKAQVGLGNVDNKSSETIRSEITSQNVVDALGYTPGTSNFSGAYDDLSGKPTNVSTFTNDAGYITDSGVVYSVNNIEAVNNNVTVPIPSKVSDLQNDEHYVNGSIQNNTITIDGVSVEYGETGVGKLVQLDNNGKLNLTVIPSTILGQMIYGGTFDASTDIATLSDNAKILLGVTSDTILLKNDTTEPGGYVINEGIYYVTSVAGTFVDSAFNPKDWLVSTGSGWCKIDNTNDDIVASYRGRRGDVVPYIEDIVDGTSRKLNTTVTPLEELKAQVRTNIGAGTSNFSGDYNDLTNKPTLFSGNYNDLTNKPDLTNYVEKSQTNGLLKNDGTVDTTQYGTSNFSGDYNDLTNKPTIPVVPQNITQSVSVNGSTYTPDANGNVDLGNIGGGGGGSYTAGTGIDITNNVISVDSSLLANCIGYEEVVE